MVAMYGSQAVHILRAWKASGDEIKLAQKLVQAPANPFVCRAMHGWSLAHAQELACLLGWDQFDRAVLDAWEVPVFPVSGDDLRAMGMRPGVNLGRCLQDLKQAWGESDFQLSQAQLLARVTKNNS